MRLSYSAWKTHDTCPRKYYWSYVDKQPRREMSNQAYRGTLVHGSVDKFFQGEDDLHHEIKTTYLDWMTALRTNYPCEPEYKWAVDENWNPTGWSNSDAAWRGVIDLVISEPLLPINYEWKTGKIYDDHAYQSELYGLVSLDFFPDAEKVKVVNVYLDQRKNVEREYKREDKEGLQALWNRRRRDVMNDEYMAPNPGFYCRWCDFAKDNGGPCRF